MSRIVVSVEFKEICITVIFITCNICHVFYNVQLLFKVIICNTRILLAYEYVFRDLEDDPPKGLGHKGISLFESHRFYFDCCHLHKN